MSFNQQFRPLLIKRLQEKLIEVKFNDKSVVLMDQESFKNYTKKKPSNVSNEKMMK